MKSNLSDLWTSSLRMPDEDYVPSKGSALLVPSGTVTNPDSKHLFVVLTNPCEGGFHLLASISSVRESRAHDPTCTLEAGEHPFVQQKSYVFYAIPRQVGHAGIIKCVGSGLYVAKEPCTAALLEKMRKGLAESAMTPRWAKEYFRINGNR